MRYRVAIIAIIIIASIIIACISTNCFPLFTEAFTSDQCPDTIQEIEGKFILGSKGNTVAKFEKIDEYRDWVNKHYDEGGSCPTLYYETDKGDDEVTPGIQAPYSFAPINRLDDYEFNLVYDKKEGDAIYDNYGAGLVKDPKFTDIMKDQAGGSGVPLKYSDLRNDMMVQSTNGGYVNPSNPLYEYSQDDVQRFINQYGNPKFRYKLKRVGVNQFNVVEIAPTLEGEEIMDTYKEFTGTNPFQNVGLQELEKVTNVATAVQVQPVRFTGNQPTAADFNQDGKPYAPALPTTDW